MKNYIEIKDRILELMETLEEGFVHIRKQLSELRHEEALALFVDSMEGITAIEETIEIIKKELPGNEIDIFLQDVLGSMNEVVDSYTKKEHQNIENLIITKVIPSFDRWREEVERALRHNSLS